MELVLWESLQPQNIQTKRARTKRHVKALGRTKLQILETVNTLDRVTTDQLRRILGADHRNTQRHVTELSEGSYLLSEPIARHYQRGGSSPHLYRLSDKAKRLLKQRGVVFQNGWRHDIPHNGLCVELIAKAFELDKELPGVSLLSFKNEKELNNHPLSIEVPFHIRNTYEELLFSGDVWLRFSVAGQFEYVFWAEIFLTDPGHREWKKRVRAILSLMAGYGELDNYEDFFKTPTLTTVPVLVASKEQFPRSTRPQVESEKESLQRRLARSERERLMGKLLSWTEEEAKSLGLEELSDVFAFRNVAMDSIDPFDLFFGQEWVAPITRQAVSLFPPTEDDLRY